MQKGKQKSHKQRPKKRNGRTSPLPLFSAVIVVGILIFGFLLFLTSPSYFSKLVSSPTPTASVVEKSKCATPSQISPTPIPEAKAISWLEMPGKVKTGTTVPLILGIKNIGNKNIVLELESVIGYPLSHSFRVTDLNGTEVWYWEQPRSNLDMLTTRKLSPDEILTVQGEWKQVDNRGNHVPPGTYFVQGIASGVKTCLMILTIIP